MREKILELTPRVGTSVMGKGRVAGHTVSRFGLHATVIELGDGYPDLETWMRMLPKGARVLEYDYAERFGLTFTGILRIYWKENG